MISSQTFLPRSSSMGRLQKSNSQTSDCGTSFGPAACCSATAAGPAVPSAAAHRHRSAPLLLGGPLRVVRAGDNAADATAWRAACTPAATRGARDKRHGDRPFAAAAPVLLMYDVIVCLE
jgi:hypothetical protein